MIAFRVGNKKRIVLKIGTNLLIDKQGIKEEKIKCFQEAIDSLDNYEIILISSGAVALGNSKLYVNFKHEDDVMRNVSASIGQHMLMASYSKYFKRNIGQILLSSNDLSNRETSLRLNEVLENMLKRGIVPIINENDVLRSQANKFKDNDHLAMKIASNMQADLLIILTNVAGVYTKDPREADAALVKEIDEQALENISIGKKNGSQSLGGMQSKITSALISSKLGIRTVIANGNEENIIQKILAGEFAGTSFKAKEKVRGKMRWIMLSKEKGKIIVDDGAQKALEKKNSLLAVGVKSIEGHFLANDIVEIICNGKAIAKALIDYNSDKIREMIGKTREEIEKKFNNYKCIAKHENIIMIK